MNSGATKYLVEKLESATGRAILHAMVERLVANDVARILEIAELYDAEASALLGWFGLISLESKAGRASRQTSAAVALLYQAQKHEATIDRPAGATIQ